MALPSMTSQPCVLTSWGSWGACSAWCLGTRTRTRSVQTPAVNAASCDNFVVSQTESCGATVCTVGPTPQPTTAPTFAYTPETWYNLNSGQTVRAHHSDTHTHTHTHTHTQTHTQFYQRLSTSSFFFKYTVPFNVFLQNSAVHCGL